MLDEFDHHLNTLNSSICLHIFFFFFSIKQCGVGNQTATITTPTKIHYSGKQIVKMACGGDFSMILDSNGSLYSFGSPE